MSEYSKRGIRGRIAANKKEELTSYMRSAVALIRTYVPPVPAKAPSSEAQLIL